MKWAVTLLALAIGAGAIAWPVTVYIRRPATPEPPCRESATKRVNFGVQSTECTHGGKVTVEGDWTFCRCRRDTDGGQ